MKTLEVSAFLEEILGLLEEVQEHIGQIIVIIDDVTIKHKARTIAANDN